MLRQNIKSQSYQGVHRHLALLDYAAMCNYISSQLRTPSFILLDFCTRFFWYISGGLKKSSENTEYYVHHCYSAKWDCEKSSTITKISGSARYCVHPGDFVARN